jgi:hypothetical protein
MTFKFFNQIREIFPAASESEYQESSRIGSVEFEIRDDVTFEQLVKLSSLLGTTTINITSDVVDYPTTGASGFTLIRASEVSFS